MWGGMDRNTKPKEAGRENRKEHKETQSHCNEERGSERPEGVERHEIGGDESGEWRWAFEWENGGVDNLLIIHLSNWNYGGYRVEKNGKIKRYQQEYQQLLISFS